MLSRCQLIGGGCISIPSTLMFLIPTRQKPAIKRTRPAENTTGNLLIGISNDVEFIFAVNLNALGSVLRQGRGRIFAVGGLSLKGDQWFSNPKTDGFFLSIF